MAVIKPGNEKIRGGHNRSIDNERVVEGANIPFGAVVTNGANDRMVKLFAGAGTVLGMACIELAIQDKNNGDHYVAGDMPELELTGVNTIKLGATVTKGESLAVKNADGCTFAPAGTADHTDVNVVALESGVADDIIEVHVNFLSK